MGQKEAITGHAGAREGRLVLDTNVLVSALLFRSEASGLFDAWCSGEFRMAVSEAILDEYERVLGYPKFRLRRQEREAIMRQYVLPFCDRYKPEQTRQVCTDPDDDKFFHCASAAHAALVSGDRAVLALAARTAPVRVLTVREALALFKR